ncbi:MAG: tetratricopeptide repeat protein [Akkermansiaceae bacterium]
MSQNKSQDNTAEANAGRGSGSKLSRMMHEGRSFSSYERNCVYLNTGASSSGDGRFANISSVSGLGFPDDGRAVVLTDWDHDGDLDMWISNRNAPRLRLMRNEHPSGNHFLMLRLVGDGKTTNRDGIGARVEVVLGGSDKHRPLIKTLRAGEGFLAQSSKWIHCGLGKSDKVDHVTVRWPGGKVERFSDFTVDQRYQLVQGSGAAKIIGDKSRKTVLLSASQEPKLPSQTARIPLVELLPMPRSLYEDLNGKKRQLPIVEGRLLLVNLWASWCPSCQTELKEFSERYKELQSAGIDVLALSVEGLEEDAASGMRAAKKFVVGKFPFSVGLATASLVSDFQSEHNHRLPLHKQLPLPTSFLVDRDGRLSFIYKGKVSVDQLLEDVAHSKVDRHARIVRSSPIGGSAIKHPHIEQVALKESEMLRFNVAADYQSLGRIDEVVRQYADAVRVHSRSYMAHSNLGDALSKLGRNTEAIDHLRKASNLKPDEAVPHYNIANILNGQGRVSSAIEHYQNALKLDPDFANAHKNLAITFQGRGRFVEAISHFQEAIRIDPDAASPHLGLGQIAKALGKPDDAINYFETALMIDPKYAEAHGKLAIVLQEQSKIELAIGHFQKALKLKPELTEARFNLANALHQQGNVKEAVGFYRQVLTNMPSHPMVMTRLGDGYRDLGDADKAIQQYSNVLKLKPEFPPAMNGLAWIRATHPEAKWRDGKQAVALAERCVKITQMKFIPAMNTLAAAYAEMRRFDDAISWQKNVIEKSPEGQTTELKKRLKLFQQGMPYREKFGSGGS